MKIKLNIINLNLLELCQNFLNLKKKGNNRIYDIDIRKDITDLSFKLNL